MTSKALHWALISLLFLCTGVVHAEGGCPPGMIPASGTDINSCAPIPPGYYSNQQHVQPQPPQPPAQWKDQWGAIATDFAHSSAGASVNQPNREAAEQAAIANCQSNGGSTCKVELWYINQCAAMAVSDTGHNAKAGATPDAANQAAMKVCSEAGDTNCRVYYSACSLPQRIQ
ncbi:MAG: DUF4189 domain-containing protein [Pseudomonadota bacterium]|jgi:hypothetical protein